MEKTELKEVLAEFHIPSIKEMHAVKRHIKLQTPIFLGGVCVDKSGEQAVVHKYEDTPNCFSAYKSPSLPLNLNEGFDPNEDSELDNFRELKTDVIVDGLKKIGVEEILRNGEQLAKIVRCHKPKAPRFLTFRNNLNKIMMTSFNRVDPYRIRVSRDKNNLIKLELVDFENEFSCGAAKMKQFQYWGKRFEKYCFPKSQKLLGYMAIETTSIGHHTVIFGAEIDGYDPRFQDGDTIEQGSWVEVKTKMNPYGHPRKLHNFLKFALLKTWIKASITGIPTIIYGFRDEKGEVEKIKVFKTKKIPKRKDVKWNALAPASFLDRFLTFLVDNTLAGGEYLVEFNGKVSDKITLRLY